MLFPAPYEVPEKTAKKAAKGARRGLRRKGAPDMMSEGETRSSSAEDDDEEEGEDDSPPEVGRKKRTASTHLEAKAPKRGKGFPADNSAWDVDSSPERPSWARPRAASPARDSSLRSSSEGSLDPKERASMSPPPAYSPSTKGDDEEASQRASSDRGRAPEIVRVVPQEDSWAAGYTGEKAPAETDGATTEVAALKKALDEAEEKAAKEHAAREKHEAQVSKIQQELQDAIKKYESLERGSKAQESELAKARKSVQDARAEPQSALEEVQADKKITADLPRSVSDAAEFYRAEEGMSTKKLFSYFGLANRLVSACPWLEVVKRSVCIEGARMAFAHVKTHWVKMDSKKLMTEGRPEGKEHR
nr:rRNA biogenesis protein RRP36-like [Aegilops tauschii subsp. strangulata]